MGNGGNSPRSVLVCTYRFPPVASINAIRVGKLVKHLQRIGWECTVITPEWSEDTDRDRGLLEDVPAETNVIRVGESRPYVRSPVLEWCEGIPGLWRLPLALERNLLLFPDEGRRWMPIATERLEKELASGRHAVLFTSAPPFTLHLAAARVAARHDVPWVADFRDPWSDNVLRTEQMWRIARVINRWLERKVLRRVNRVVANTRVQYEEFLRKEGVTEDRLAWIPNGYDEDDFDATAPQPDADVFTISYVGSAYFSYNPSWFLSAISQLLAEGNLPDLRLQFSGSSAGWVQEFVDRDVVRSRLVLRDSIPHKQVPRSLIESDALLLVLHAGENKVPAKFYEYLRAGRPIIAVGTAPGDVGAILEETGRGRFIARGDSEALKAHVLSLYRSWEREPVSEPWPVDEAVARFDYRELAGRLDEVFRGVLEGGSEAGMK